MGFSRRIATGRTNKSLIFLYFSLLEIGSNPYAPGMRFLIVILAALALNSCNTLIGIGRDTKQGYNWTKDKIQNSGGGGGGGGQDESYGAPVY